MKLQRTVNPKRSQSAKSTRKPLSKRTKLAGFFGCFLLAAVCFFQSQPNYVHSTKPIEQIRVGDRLVGYNPIREQADHVDPDPDTWRKIKLYMEKEGGLSLWIELLRPLTWIESTGAKPGKSIPIELYEFGAVGDAKVTALDPCPEIKPGPGTVVTGTFKHQADRNSNVVQLRLEGQAEATGVTDNHPYWSVERQEFVNVGDLREGERVDTKFGVRRVVSITPVEYTDFLYNFETTEHVYRVGSLGTLVHNA